jgi:hypothetical protein
MIESYGLHWYANKVFWGRPKVAGTLLGKASKSANAIPVDFREQRGVYALYASYELVYIGQTGAGNDRLLKRLKSHKIDHLADRWDRFSWFGTQWVTKQHVLSEDTAQLHPTVEIALNKLEAIAIAIAEPRLNLQRGRWADATQYFQHGKRDTMGGELEDEYEEGLTND